MREFTITVADQDGVVLDAIEVSEDEFRAAQHSGMAAQGLLHNLAVGD